MLSRVTRGHPPAVAFRGLLLPLIHFGDGGEAAYSPAAS